MTEGTISQANRSKLPFTFAVVHTVLLIGVLVAAFLTYRVVADIAHVNRELMTPEISSGPPQWGNGGALLESVQVERIGEGETIPVGERRPVIAGEWIHVTRYSEKFEQVTENGRTAMVRKSVWIHIPSRSKLTLTYSDPRQAGASGQ